MLFVFIIILSVFYGSINGDNATILENQHRDKYWSLLQLIDYDATSWKSERNVNLNVCINKIISAHYQEKKNIIFVDMNYNDDYILKVINSERKVSVITRHSNRKVIASSEVYLIAAGTVKDFAMLLPYLTKELFWNPHAKFLIMINSFDDKKLETVFDSLLKYHINDVLVVMINGTDPILYTYNPFENYACGKYYSRIINHGVCLNTSIDLYPYKLTTRLRNCTFNATVSHWPPYSIDPFKVEDGMPSMGTEQYVLTIIANLEQFNINFTYNNDAEEFSIIKNDMSTNGPMSKLQKNETDIMLGGLFLIPARAAAFNYLYSHLVYTDEIRVLVKKASLVPAWKNFYLEFKPVVWALLLLALIIYSLLLITLLREPDKGFIFLKLLDILLLHGYNIQSRTTVKCIFIIWIWSAYLVNCFYQSSLMSLTTKPASEYQVADGESLGPNNIRPCISPVMLNFINSGTNIIYRRGSRRRSKGCENFMESIKSVSKSKYLFTLVINSIYLYESDKFNDEWGTSSLYSFKKPIAKVIYGIFFYKGFPMQERMNLLTLRIKESGLIEKSVKDLSYLKEIKHRYKDKSIEARFAAPWLLYAVGCFFAFTILVVEVSSTYKTNNVHEIILSL